MSFFSRLSDIISVRLDDLLAESGEPATAIGRIVAEIEEGLTGARRSVHSAAGAEQRLRADLEERQAQVAAWTAQAREELAAGRDDAARQSLLRKRETEDLVAGLEQQLAAATSTREHLTTTLRAIEARLAEARRRQRELHGEVPPAPRSTPVAQADSAALERSRAAEVEADLEALRREIRGG